MSEYFACQPQTLFRAVLCLLLGVVGLQADAALLATFPDQLTLGPHPDMFAQLTLIDYDEPFDTLTITGRPTNFVHPNGTSYNDFEDPPTPTFSITANIDSLGAIGGGGGSLSITGIITSLGNANPTLLLGTLDEFGFDNPAAGVANFQLVFSIFAGELAPLYAGGKAYVQVAAIDFGSNFNGGFLQSFDFIQSRASNLTADTFGLTVPEPSSAHLLLMAWVSIVGAHRRKVRFLGWI